MNDQENIKRLRSNEKRDKEWAKIHKDMEAGSGATKVDVATVFFDDKSSMAQIVNKLKEELKIDQKWMKKYNSLEVVPEDGDEKICEGRIEALEFAIKTIKRHNKGYEADQYTGRCGA